MYFHRALGLAIFDIILDVGTDLLIIGIPLRLLWSVKIKPRQKLVLGIFLSLNLFMAIVASIRVSRLKIRGIIDDVWLFIWQQIEACVAVAMVSLTAFRSAFVKSENSGARNKAAKKPWYSSTVHAIRHSRPHRRSDEENLEELPSIPFATLTGMRTFIAGGRHSRKGRQISASPSSFDGELDDWPLHNGCQESKQTV